MTATALFLLVFAVVLYFGPTIRPFRRGRMTLPLGYIEQQRFKRTHPLAVAGPR